MYCRNGFTNHGMKGELILLFHMVLYNLGRPFLDHHCYALRYSGDLITNVVQIVKKKYTTFTYDLFVKLSYGSASVNFLIYVLVFGY